VPYPAKNPIEEMDGTPATPRSESPNIARMYNCILGGKDHFPADRSAVEEVFECAPEMPSLVRADRHFLIRAVRHLAEEKHIKQFIELGCGIPSWPNVHEVADYFRVPVRVAYVDNDAVAVSHARARLDNGANVVAIEGDLCRPESILEDSRLRQVIDFDRPVAVLCTAVLHLLDDSADPVGVMGAFRDVMAPSSALVISHVSGDHVSRQTVGCVERIFERTRTPMTVRTRGEITDLFEGFELPHPGLTDVGYWPLRNGWPAPASMAIYGGVARVTRVARG
jgi:hypothetical protein